MTTRTFHRRFITAVILSAVGAIALLFLANCGQRKAAAEATPPAAAKPESLQVREPATTRPDSTPAYSAPQPGPNPNLVDPGGVVEVKATRADLSRVGAAKCKTCHAVQFKSWSAGAHAKRTPPLDCESCHGAGSLYKTMAVMKDPAQARAAGLVVPGREFCATCHRTGWTDDMLARAHAHKAAVGAK